MYPRRRHLLRLAALAVALAVPQVASAQWKAKPQRRATMSHLAQKHGLTPASGYTTRRLNERFKSTLGTENVYYTTWERFQAFAGEAKNVALGASYLDHGGGPHAHIVVGDRERDGIDPNIPGTFGDGKKTRDRSWLERRGTGRVVALWEAPVESLTRVGVWSDETVRNQACHGKNCVEMVNGNLAAEAREDASPFRLLRPNGYPNEGAEAVFGADPDIVIQIVDQPSYDAIRQNHEGHLLKPWNDAYN